MASVGAAWLVLLFLCYITVSSAVVITTKPTDNTVLLGSEPTAALLTCTADTTESVESLTWKKGDDPLCMVPQGKVSEKDCAFEANFDDKYKIGDTKYDLHIKDSGKIDYDYAGSYTCSAIPGGATEPEKTGPAVLTVVDNAVCPTPSVTMEVGMTEEISCTVNFNGNQPTPIITLKDSTANITGVTAADKADAKFTTKTISVSLTPEKAGTVDYKCGINEAASKKCDIKVIVQEAATIEKRPKDTSVEVGKPGNLPCTVKSDAPYTKVDWKRTPTGGSQETICTGYKTENDKNKNGCTEAAKADFEIDDPDKHDLKIKAMKVALVGTYQCFESNEEFYSAELMAIKAESLKCPESESKMTCEFQYKGNNQPTVKWYEGDSAIKDLKQEKTDDDWNTVKLVAEVKDVKKNYDCKIINGDGSEAATCRGHNTASGLSANLYQSMLLSAVVLWLWYRVL